MSFEERQESLVAGYPVDLTEAQIERAALVVKRHAKDEADLSHLLNALGIAV
jgi:hypothetical protein